VSKFSVKNRFWAPAASNIAILSMERLDFDTSLVGFGEVSPRRPERNGGLWGPRPRSLGALPTHWPPNPQHRDICRRTCLLVAEGAVERSLSVCPVSGTVLQIVRQTWKPAAMFQVSSIVVAWKPSVRHRLKLRCCRWMGATVWRPPGTVKCHLSVMETGLGQPSCPSNGSRAEGPIKRQLCQ